MKVLDFLRGQVPATARIFIVSGTESFLRQQAVQKILATLDPDVEVRVRFAVSKTDSQGTQIADLLDELRMRNLFGGECLLHVKSSDQLVSENKKILQRFVGAGEAQQRLILEGEAIAPKNPKGPPKTGLLGAVVAAGGLIISCPALYDRNFGGRGPAWDSPLSRWVQGRARELGRQISVQDAFRLHRLTGTDLRSLDGELHKLVLYTKGRELITGEDVEEVASGGRTAPVWLLCEAVGSRRLSEALEQSRILFEEGAQDGSGRTLRDPQSVAIYTLRCLTFRLQKILLAADLLDRGLRFEDAAQEVHETPWGRDRLRAQVQAFKDPAARARVLAALLQCERRLKISAGPARLLLESFLHAGIGSACSFVS